MTTLPRLPAGPQRFLALATLLLLLAGCVSAPLSTHPNASARADAGTDVAVAAATPSPLPRPPDAGASATPASETAASQGDESVAAPVPIDPERPDVHINIDDRSARVDLWQRVRKGFAIPDIDNDMVHESERWYAARPDYVARMTERGSRYLFYIVEELHKRNMPTELALLPFIESAYNPQAMSVARASGMWQFVPSTGRDYELKQNIFRDDRRDVLASTRAALDYLQKLHDMFGDWQLALAPYNWGEGSVQKAVARNQKAGLPTDYASLRMPAETRMYLPKLQAVKNIIMRPADFGLQLPELMNHPYFLSVPIEHDMDVAIAAQIAGMPLDEFRALNPQMNRPVILAAGTPQVLLPYDNANRFVRELPRHRGPLATWTAWTAPKTMKPAEAARHVGMSEAQLRDVNHIPARMLIKVGSTLLVPRGSSRDADVPSHVADNAVLALAPDAPPLRRVSLRAGRHESVASVARRYRVNPVQVAQWNGVSAKARFAPGQRIVVFVAPARQIHRSAAVRTAAASHKGSSQHHVVAAARSRATQHVARARRARSAPATKHARARSPQMDLAAN
ncbi:MAG TPA: transglycosylase SLT domain-containing protein [Caldimonas sp.]|nr:transglycosylase SLT domain-containing protein [Caldimonas sp.]